MMFTIGFVIFVAGIVVASFANDCYYDEPEKSDDLDGHANTLYVMGGILMAADLICMIVGAT